ncbi:MAG TPA: hypothetical protein VGG64_16880 [Pirellulales bacterium]|jgi:hypothetical protein
MSSSAGAKGLVAGTLLVCVLGGALFFWIERQDTKWPTGSDEERLARAMLDYDRAMRSDWLSVQLRRFELIDEEFEWVTDVAAEIFARDGARAIPLLIGVIEADNSSSTLCGIGYHMLGTMANVEQDAFHDGAWWRRWWEQHKAEYPADVRAIPIPRFDKSDFGRRRKPYPDDIDTLQAKLRLAPELVAAWKSYNASGRAGPQPEPEIGEYAAALRANDDPHAIPYLIGLIAAVPRSDTAYRVGFFGLGYDPRQPWSLTDVEYDESHDAVWWLQWWQENKYQYQADVQAIAIPDFRRPLSFAWHESTDDDKWDELHDVPSIDTTVAGNDQMRYFLHGPRAAVEAPSAGYKLVVAITGGNGGPAFAPMVRRLLKYAMSEEFIVAEPVALPHRGAIVWPTRGHYIEEIGPPLFFSEDFVEAVIQDIGRRHSIDRRFVFTLAWNSSVPAAFAIAMQESTAVTGSYISLLVLPTEWPGSLAAAKGRSFLLTHTLRDSQGRFTWSKQSLQQLIDAGAIVKSTDHGDPRARLGLDYDQVREGLQWLVGQAEVRAGQLSAP